MRGNLSTERHLESRRKMKGFILTSPKAGLFLKGGGKNY